MCDVCVIVIFEVEESRENAMKIEKKMKKKEKMRQKYFVYIFVFIEKLQKINESSYEK